MRRPALGGERPEVLHHVAVRHRLLRARYAIVASVLSLVVFALYLAWWVTDGGLSFDAFMVRITDSLLQGWVDAAVSATWPLGEPVVGVLVVLAVGLVAWKRRRFFAALLIVGGFAVLSAMEVTLVVAMAHVRHVELSVDALTHIPPNGHTARVPYLGTVVASIAGPRIQAWILAATATLALAVTADRISSLKLTGSAAVGGLLMGTAAALWFETLFSAGIEPARRRDP